MGLLAVLWTAPAMACGGLFCARGNPDSPTPPAPVDQNAERIIFTVNDDTVTAEVMIQYTGSASDFAWVVPVPDVPDVEESEAQRFQDLEDATTPSVTLPDAEPCPTVAVAESGGSNSGCFGSSEASAGASLAEREEPRAPKVTVLAHDFTDNFEYHVVDALDSAVLVEWLNDNDYNVSENMTPAMDVYLGNDARFLAVKLREGKAATDIVPLALTYPGSEPMIPIQLTAVAAQPLMGILVWIVGDTPYAPKAPWTANRLTPDPLVFDATGRTSIFEWTARRADEADGRWFSIEHVGAWKGRTATRLYTRMSPHHMTSDPAFEARPDLEDGAVDLDFSERPTLWACGGILDVRVPSLCAFNYCGKGATCGVQDGMVGCICPEDQVAQTILGPEGTPTVTCVPRSNPLGITDEAGGVGGQFDPCDDIDCGGGSCVVRGGFVSCECDDGHVACLEGGGNKCVPIGDSWTTFGPGAGRESDPTVAGIATLEPVTFRYAAPWGPSPLVWLFAVCLGGLLAARHHREQ